MHFLGRCLQPNESFSARLRVAYSEDDDEHIPFVQVEHGDDGVTINNVTNATNDFGDNVFELLAPMPAVLDGMIILLANCRFLT